MGIKTAEMDAAVTTGDTERLVEIEGVEKLRNMLPNLRDEKSTDSRANQAVTEVDQLQIILHAIRYIESLQHDLGSQEHRGDQDGTRRGDVLKPTS